MMKERDHLRGNWDTADFGELLQQQEMLREVIESISSELELRPLLTRIIHHACTLIGADNGTIGLVDEQRQVIRTEAVYCMPANELGAEMALGVGLAGQVYLSQQPIILGRYSEVPQPTQPELAEHTVIGLPIFWRSHMIGFFGIGAAPPRRFTERDVETLSLFARHAAIAMENARLFEAEKRRATRIAIINRVGRLITSSLNLDQLLQTAVEAIAEYLYYHNVALLLVDPTDPETLVLHARSGVYTTSAVKSYRQKIDQGIIGAAIQDRHYLLINDVWHDPRYLPIPGAEAIVAELAVPIIIGERVLGALNIESEHRMSPGDAAGFEIIADQLGVAIENARLFSEIQDALSQTQLLYETSQRISMAMDVDEVIQAYLEQVAVRGHYACNIVLYELDRLGQRSAIIVRGRWTPQEGLVQVAESLPYMRDTLDPLLDAGETIMITDVYNDPRVPPDLRQLQIKDQRPALALIPLMARGQRIGLVVLSDSAVREWQPADLHLYRATAVQLATAIDNRRQHHLLSERGRQIAVLQERQRLARDLHDSVTQLIFSMTLIAQSIGSAWRRDPIEGEQRISRLLELSQLTLAEMRALLAELRPPPAQATAEGGTSPPFQASQSLPPQPLTASPTVQIRQAGLPGALQNYITHVIQEGLNVDLNLNGYSRQPVDQEEALYRITQEALNNIVKHAQAHHVEITLYADPDSIHLTVADDGVGFRMDPSQTSSHPQAEGSSSTNRTSRGMGLLTMRERTEELGGIIQLITSPGLGTKITVTFPRKDRSDL
jgi:GAF domain-containing protein/anti-sigma regulatory factor (Ser/Thr protein kinase)